MYVVNSMQLRSKLEAGTFGPGSQFKGKSRGFPSSPYELIDQSIAMGWIVVECNQYPNMSGGCKSKRILKRTMSPANMVCVLRGAVLGIMDEDIYAGCQFESRCQIGILWEAAYAQSGLMIG